MQHMAFHPCVCYGASFCSWITHFRRASFLGQRLYSYFVFSSEKANSEINCWYYSMKIERRKVLKQGHSIEIWLKPSHLYLPMNSFAMKADIISLKELSGQLHAKSVWIFFKSEKSWTSYKSTQILNLPLYLRRTISLVRPCKLQEIV